MKTHFRLNPFCPDFIDGEWHHKCDERWCRWDDPLCQNCGKDSMDVCLLLLERVFWSSNEVGYGHLHVCSECAFYLMMTSEIWEVSSS